jgi:hypothetical protein
MPIVRGAKVFAESSFRGGITDGGFVAGVYSGAVDMELGFVTGDPGHFWLTLSVFGLVVHRFVVCVAVHLGIKGEGVVRDLVILMSQDMLIDRSEGNLLESSGDGVDNVPISSKRGIRETLVVLDSGL